MLFEQNGVGGIRSGFKRLAFLCVPGGIEVGEGHGRRSCLRSTIALRCIIKDSRNTAFTPWVTTSGGFVSVSSFDVDSSTLKPKTI